MFNHTRFLRVDSAPYIAVKMIPLRKSQVIDLGQRYTSIVTNSSCGVEMEIQCVPYTVSLCSSAAIGSVDCVPSRRRPRMIFIRSV
jgi:hypothetical protein